MLPARTWPWPAWFASARRPSPERKDRDPEELPSGHAEGAGAGLAPVLLPIFFETASIHAYSC